MARYAIVNMINETVERVIVWDGVAPIAPCHAEDEIVSCDPQVGPGWLYIDGTFYAPAPAPEA